MKGDKLTRRISLEVPKELYDRLWNCFEWGERNRAITRVLEWLCEKIERHGKQALIIILREQSFEQLLMLKKDEESQDGNH